MLRVTNLTRRYGDFCAVDNISFSIGQGEIIGLLGHNGAGKTTTMKMVTGFLEPTHGEIYVGERNIKEHAVAIQSLIGYLPEALPVYPEMIVIDYLMFCAKIRKIEGSMRERAVYNAIAKTDLQPKATAQISTLSRGYKQRVGVAQALLHDPKLLILDEPTNGLDPHQTHQMRDLILNLANDATVILSTHIMQEVKATCDRVIILDSGKLTIDDSLAALQKIESVELVSEGSIDDIHACLGQFGVSGTCHTVEGEIKRISIAVNETTPVDELCNNIVVNLVQQNKRLCSITQQRQDLEQIFKDSYKAKAEAANAARVG